MRNFLLCLLLAFVAWEIVDHDSADKFAASVTSNFKALRRDN